MASERHSDTDGSDIFWPGYVDAVTNLVLNLLFLLTIMTVAVFMFALELGRASKDKPSTPPTAQKGKAVPKATTGLAEENIALKREIERLNVQLAQRVSPRVQPAASGGSAKTVEATTKVSQPLKGVDKTSATGLEVVVRFNDEAVAFTPAERDRLLDSLKPLAADGKVSIHVEVPAGFSEAKRMAFYRAMAVRNLLLELKVPKDKIDVSVVEGKKNGNASLVRVRSR
ncbi:MAG TPA: hypothetical protein VI298_18180 [Geobacteraceae bacterium]